MIRNVLQFRCLFSVVGPVLALALAAPAAAQEPEEPPEPEAPTEAQEVEPEEEDQEQEKKEKYKDFQELVEGAEAHEGFFDFYLKEDKLYLAVPRERLGEEFLMTFQIARGIGARGLFGGTMLGIFEGAVTSVERHGEKLYLKQRPHRYTASGGGAAARAVDLSYGSSVLESAKIESIRDDSALVVEVSGWFVSDLSGVGQRVNRAVSERPGEPGRASLDEGRSYLEAVKSFPENSTVRANLTFKPSGNASLRTVPDDRFVPVAVHYNLTALPETPMTPRVADDRVGYFLTARKDFSRDEETFFQRFVNRWRLEPGRRVDGLWEPEEPIVYYLDRNIPEEYRPYVEAGVEAWNEAFEAAGFRSAVRAEPLPEGVDPEDVRYATIRWNTSDQPGYGAIGPSVVDPRTGEILDADILIEANMILGFRQSWRTMVDPATAIRETFQASPEELRALSQGGETASLGAEIAAQGGLLRALLATRGEIGGSDPVPMDYVGEALKWVTMHEVGHTLGLRHNFRSSADTPLERLYDTDWTRRNGVFGSVMEYPAINLPHDGGDVPHHYNPGVGSYDRWAVAFGYTPDADRAEELARQAARDGHAYGTDEDARGRGALDPTVNVYDLGDDPLAWSRGRAELLRGLWEEVPNAVLEDDERYAKATEAFGTLLVQYARALAPAVKYVGGQYQYRDHVGDPDGRPPFVNVGPDRQREALRFLAEHAFSEDAFRLPPEVIQSFGANRWSHWGEDNTWDDGRIDYPLRGEVLEIQSALLEALTRPVLFARIQDAELKYGEDRVVAIPELLGTLTRTVWSEVYDGGGSIPGMRRDLQRAHLDRLVEILLSEGEGTPADARSVARMELAGLRNAIQEALEAGSGAHGDAAPGAYTRAHLEESLARIRAALDAGLEVRVAG